MVASVVVPEFDSPVPVVLPVVVPVAVPAVVAPVAAGGGSLVALLILIRLALPASVELITGECAIDPVGLSSDNCRSGKRGLLVAFVLLAMIPHL
jgi:hypothetical protein